MRKMTEFQHCYVIEWGIENFSMCVQQKGEGLESPPFKEEASHNQEWSLKLYPRGYDDEAFISCELINKVEVCDIFIFTISIIDSKGSLQYSKENSTIFMNSRRTFRISDFIKRDDLFTNKNSLLSNDTLTLQCVIRKPSKLHSIVQSLNVERVSFTWPIKNVSLQSNCSKYYPLTINFENAPKLIWNYYLTKNSIDEGDICLKLSKKGDSLIFIAFEITAMDCDKSVIAVFKGEHIFPASTEEEIYTLPCVKVREFVLGENAKLPNDTLLLLINYSLSNGSHQLKQPSISTSDYSQPCKVSSDDKTLCEKLYEEKRFCDVVLKVGNESLSAHKAVLCSQSSVFQAMLESDMAEKNTGVIKIVDFDVGTIKHLLRLLYSEKMDDTLSCEDLLDLYAAAHRYEVLSLKYVSSHLISKITKDSIQKIFSCAVLYEDSALKEASTSFILKHASDFLDMLLKVFNTKEHS